MRKVSSSRSSCSSGSGGGSSSNSKTLLTMILSVKMFLQGGIPRSVRTRYEKIDFLYPQACVLSCVGNLQEICMSKSPKSSGDLRDPNLLKLSHTERNRNHNDENSRSHRVLGGRGKNTGRYRALPSADSVLGSVR